MGPTVQQEVGTWGGRSGAGHQGVCRGGRCGQWGRLRKHRKPWCSWVLRPRAPAPRHRGVAGGEACRSDSEAGLRGSAWKQKKEGALGSQLCGSIKPGQCFPDSMKTGINHHKPGGGVPGNPEENSMWMVSMEGRLEACRPGPCGILCQWRKDGLFPE